MTIYTDCWWPEDDDGGDSLEGKKKNICLQSLKMEKEALGWTEFKDKVNRRFGDLGDEDGVEKFNKL